MRNHTMSNIRSPFCVALLGLILLMFAVPLQRAKGEGKDSDGSTKPKLLWGYVDTKGKYVVKPKFELAYTHYDGLALVQLAGKVGFMNPKGELVIKPQFESGADFLGGRAQVKTGGKWGFIDKTGKFVVPPTAKEFSYPLCAEAPPAFWLHRTKGDNNKYGFKTEDGKFAIPPIYEDVGFFGEGLAPVAVPADTSKTTKTKAANEKVAKDAK